VGATGGGTSHEIPEIFKKVKGNEKVLDFQKNHITIAGRSRQDLTIFPTSPIHRERFEKNMTENRQLGGESFDTGSDFASSEFET